MTDVVIILIHSGCSRRAALATARSSAVAHDVPVARIKVAVAVVWIVVVIVVITTFVIVVAVVGIVVGDVTTGSNPSALVGDTDVGGRNVVAGRDGGKRLGRRRSRAVAIAGRVGRTRALVNVVIAVGIRPVSGAGILGVATPGVIVVGTPGFEPRVGIGGILAAKVGVVHHPPASAGGVGIPAVLELHGTSLPRNIGTVDGSDPADGVEAVGSAWLAGAFAGRRHVTIVVVGSSPVVSSAVAVAIVVIVVVTAVVITIVAVVIAVVIVTIVVAVAAVAGTTILHVIRHGQGGGATGEGSVSASSIGRQAKGVGDWVHVVVGSKDPSRRQRRRRERIQHHGTSKVGARTRIPEGLVAAVVIVPVVFRRI